MRTADFAIFGGAAAQEFRTARAACVLRDVLRGSRTPRARPTCGPSVEIAEGRMGGKPLGRFSAVSECWNRVTLSELFSPLSDAFEAQIEASAS